ncbi:hypothetical protein MSTE_03778 [Mycobacteroides stephanolepidis]|uniref:Uncharacterized protein n=1 Tax=[Mycobacterium] stephanolepidis TaxID=1520670 RepID=A0A1Z4F1I8_9MYCO|nr:hypothetical protein [[Mycobacterium] stephanolepidis]BAX99076.1 hypothetical protein MSTE_03778 [[Mycobacterium] stephanolepidis]
MNRPEVKPEYISLTAADSGDILTGIVWDSWTKESAAGAGTRHTKDCVPNCATGLVKSRTVTLLFDAPKSVPDDSGWLQFTQLTITDMNGNSETIAMPIVE